jgi:energy-converting hydrogenase Eha subunit B
MRTRTQRYKFPTLKAAFRRDRVLGPEPGIIAGIDVFLAGPLASEAGMAGIIPAMKREKWLR